MAQPKGIDPKIAQLLLRGLPLSADELRTRFDRAVDPAYWRALCPWMTLRGNGGPQRAASDPPESADFSSKVDQLQTSGYFQAGPVMPAANARAMGEAVVAVRQAGWPVVFSFVYDEFWRAWSAPPIAAVLRRALGDEDGFIPHPGCWYLPATSEASGWSPHMDGWDRPNRISVWIALSDATLDNGCIYVIPKDRVADLPMRRMTAGRFKLAWNGWSPLLHRCRAVPTPQGSAIGWDFQTIHWGSVCHRPESPRISIAAYFMPLASRRKREERRLFDPSKVPAFGDRLWAVAFSIRYLGDPRNRRYARLAARLLREARPRMS